MTTRRLVVLVGRSALFGLAIALPLGDGDFVSVEIWLGVTGALIATGLLRQILSVAPFEEARMHVAWTWRRRRPVSGPDHRPRGLRAMEGIVANARHNPRAHHSGLRPRLSALADHFLPIRRAVDPQRDPAGVRDVLGDVSWLIDPVVLDRSPTVGEVDTFLDKILAEDHSVTRREQPGSE